MIKKRAKDRDAGRSKANLGHEEAKQEALSKEQFSHMKGGRVAKFPRTAKTERTGQTVGSLLVTPSARAACPHVFHSPRLDRVQLTATLRTTEPL